MKIEKLTENKIRIILNMEDLEDKNIDLQAFLSNSAETQNFLSDILNQAEREIGFVTKDCKIMIEAIASSDGIFVFTITKFASSSENVKKKKVSARRRIDNNFSSKAIYSFSSFEEFCDLCESINNKFLEDINDISKDISLYLYNNTYYLAINNININSPHLKGFYTTLSEFAKLINHSYSFEAKLIEHGKVIIKKNAIKKGISYFA